MIEFGIYNKNSNKTIIIIKEKIMSKIKDIAHKKIMNKFIDYSIDDFKKIGICKGEQDYSFLVLYNEVDNCIDIYHGYEPTYRIKNYIMDEYSIYDILNNSFLSTITI